MVRRQQAMLLISRSAGVLANHRLNRRTRGKALTWEKYVELLRRHPLLLPRIAHSWNWAGSSV